MFAITSYVCVSDVVVAVYCYCSRCHTIRQYSNMFGPLSDMEMEQYLLLHLPCTYVACIILITVVTATHCGIISDELLLRHADMNIWKLRQSCIPSGNYPNTSIIYVS